MMQLFKKKESCKQLRHRGGMPNIEHPPVESRSYRDAPKRGEAVELMDAGENL